MFTPLADLMLDLPSNDEGYDDRIFKPVLVPLLPNMAAAGYGQRQVRLVDWLSIDYWDSDKQKNIVLIREPTNMLDSI